MTHQHFVRVWMSLMLCGLWLATPQRAAVAEETTQMAASVQDGTTVSINYTLTVDGKTVESSEKSGPLKYIHGKGQLIPGLERELTGLHIGDEKKVTVKPKAGYGAVDPKALVEVPRSQLPPDMKPETGMTVQGTNPTGQPFRARIDKVGKDTVTLDFNHPLAGKTLRFAVKVVELTPAQ